MNHTFLNSNEIAKWVRNFSDAIAHTKWNTLIKNVSQMMKQYWGHYFDSTWSLIWMHSWLFKFHIIFDLYLCINFYMYMFELKFSIMSFSNATIIINILKVVVKTVNTVVLWYCHFSLYQRRFILAKCFNYAIFKFYGLSFLFIANQKWFVSNPFFFFEVTFY